MTRPLMFFKCDEIPSLGLGEAVEKRIQGALPFSNETPRTSMTYSGPAEDDRFDRYDILLQLDRKVDGVVNQQPVNHILINKRMPTYYHRAQGYLLVESSGLNARRAFERLATAEPPVRAHATEIDLHQVAGMGKATGAHFGKLQISKVTAASLFGTDDVSESDDYARYSELGELSAIIKRTGTGPDDRSFWLLKDRSLVLYQSLGDASDLAFAADMQELIDSAS